MVLSRESISGSHLCPWGDLPDDIKVPEEEGPVSLVMSEFARILEVGQVLMVGENRDRMQDTLQVLSPFSQSENDYQEFAVIDVVILFCSREGPGEISAGMEIA